jgi:hypothetical protein
MFIWIIKVSILSITLIFLVHYLINFFKNNLTVPKIKDLVNVSNQKYDEMYNVIGKNYYSKDVTNTYSSSPINDDEIGYTEFDLLPHPAKPDEGESMKDELKQFLKTQLNTFS